MIKVPDLHRATKEAEIELLEAAGWSLGIPIAALRGLRDGTMVAVPVPDHALATLDGHTVIVECGNHQLAHEFRHAINAAAKGRTP